MPIEILLVEDNSGDVRLTKEAFRATNKLVSIHVVCDGIETMAFLRQQGAYAGAPRPAGHHPAGFGAPYFGWPQTALSHQGG